jgi:hypothetical protein
MKTLLVRLGMSLMLAAGVAGAQPPDEQQPLPALEAMRARLNLTAEQEAQIEPMLVRRKGELQETRTRLTNLDSRAEKRSVVKYARQEQEIFNTQVEGVLTPPQVTEWRKMRAETRDRLKRYWKATQGGG